MLPQTNLQLYRKLIEARWRPEDLRRARDAYDLARALFAGAYRPSHKPFVCHLVGTAGALVTWRVEPDVVLAGLLHSAYLYGDFADGEHGATRRRRSFVQQCVGPVPETIVYEYTQAKRDKSAATSSRALSLVRLADRLDEWSDGGPRFAPGKSLGARGGHEQALAESIAQADRLVGEPAVRMFEEAAAVCRALEPDESLTTRDRAFHKIFAGDTRLRRPYLARRVVKLANRFRGDAAA